ncbi:MAG: hypothetical protein ACKO4K_03555 [Flavobacteriales bacterium]
MVRKRDIKKAGLTTLFMGMSVLGFAQPTLINPFLSYGFGLQKMDFFHQVSMGIQRPKVRLELQQGFGQRNLSSGILLSQTGVQGAYRIMCRNSSVNPYLRYAYGRLGVPFKFTHHQAECGVLYVYEWSNASKIPLDLLCSAGIGRGLEMQSQGSRHSYLDYSINVGIQYAFR